jgi:hypothetical protein
MKKIAAVIFFAVIFLTINLANANPIQFYYLPTQPVTTPPNIVIQSPIQGSIQNENITWLNFTVSKPVSWFNNQSEDEYHPIIGTVPDDYESLVKIESWHYELDNVTGPAYPIDDLYVSRPTPQENFNFSTNLNLTEGFHNLSVIVQSQSFYRDIGSKIGDKTYSKELVSHSDTVNFTFDPVMPTVSFQKFDQNKTFNTGNITLSLVLNKPISQITYSLDNQGNITTNGNKTFSIIKVLNGEHTLTLYVTDDYGANSETSKISFNVNAPEPFPTLTILTITIIIVAIASTIIGLINYRKKIKSRNID